MSGRLTSRFTIRTTSAEADRLIAKRRKGESTAEAIRRLLFEDENRAEEAARYRMALEALASQYNLPVAELALKGDRR